MIFQRLNYLDSLRAFAMYLGIVLHSTIPFLPWYGDYEEKDGYGILVLLIHGFRMPLFMIIFLQTSTGEGLLGRGLKIFLQETLVASYLVLLLLDILLHIVGYGGGIQTVQNHDSE